MPLANQWLCRTSSTGGERRWAAFIDAAIRLGATAVLACPLSVGAQPFGTLTLYHHHREIPPPHILLDLRELADIGATILLADKAELLQRIDGTSRSSAVHIAAGILSERLGITTDEAMIQLRALAYSHGRPLLDLASEIILDGPPRPE